MAELPDFNSVYEGKPILEGMDTKPPWDIGEPQPAISALETEGRFTSPVLDAGCGNGPVSIYLARRGYHVLGIDSSQAAIEQAIALATEEGLAGAEFAVADVTSFTTTEPQFNTVVDCTLFHTIPPELRDTYLTAMHRVSRAGAALYILCFTDSAPFPPDMPGPYLLGENELHGYFGRGWELQSLSEATVTARIPEPAREYLPGDIALDEKDRALLPAWLASARRVPN